MSTAEVEFIAAGSCVCQEIWLRKVPDKLGLNQGQTTVIQCDISSAIKLSNNLVLHGQRKHIDVRSHFMRELSKAGIVE